MGTLMMIAIVSFFGMAFMSLALYVAASPGETENRPPVSKTVWVPVGSFFKEETADEAGASPIPRSQAALFLEEHIRREHAAATNFLTVLTPEALHAPIDPKQMD